MKRIGLITLSLFGLAAVGTGAALAAEPPEIFTQKCLLCHEVGGVGGKKKDVGGKLDGVGAKHDEAWFRAYIPDPKSKLPDSKMKKFNLSPADMDAVVAYLMTLKTK